MNPAPSRIPARPLRLALLAAGALVLCYHLALEASTLGLSEPLGYPEVVYRHIAEVWPHQYQFGHFVDAQDNYGPGYSTFCRPFLYFCADAYQAARVANLAALVLASAILLWVLRSNRVSWGIAVAADALFFALNAGSSSLQARPDFLGTLLIVAILALGRPSVLGKLNTASAAVLLGLLGLAAFLTKPYCALAWGAVVTFPFVAGTDPGLRPRSLAIAAASAAVLAAGLWGFAQANPYYLTETVLFHYAHSDPSLRVLLVQIRDFGGLACGLLAVLAMCLLRNGGVRATLWPRDEERRYWMWSLALGALALAGGLGWHRGAYLTYFHHLVLPSLAVAAGLAAEELAPSIAAVALVANCAVLMALAPSMPRTDRDWLLLQDDVARQKGPIVVDYMLDPLGRARADARVAGNGINRFALDEPDLIGGHSQVIAEARQEVRDYLGAERAQITLGPGPEAIYMDCYLFPGRPGDPRVSVNAFLAVPRNEHPTMLNGYDMSRYAPERLFVIHPYYGSQNSPRQQAGEWVSTIVKWVRTGPGHASAPKSPLPIVLVAPTP